MIVAPVPAGTKLADTIAPLDIPTLKAFLADGIRGVIAYLNGNLTEQLLTNCMSLGMGVIPVNFSHQSGWIPTATLGAQDGAASLRALKALGVPLVGLNDWIDIEGCGADPTLYIDSYAQTITGNASGIVPGEYVGAGGLLNAQKLYALPGVHAYWHSCSQGIPEPECGFVMVQLPPPNIIVPGTRTEVDYDFACRDFRGRAPTWLVAA